MEYRNPKPDDTSNLPIITLAVLVAFIVSLLFIGYEYFSDGPTTDIEQITERQAKEAETLESTDKATSTAVAVSKPEPKKEVVSETPKPEPQAEKIEEAKPEKKEEIKAESVPAGGITITHTVAAGETFYGIANRYGLKTDALKALNPDVDPQTIGSGKNLKVKIKARHTIGPGDILSVVAKKYNITKEQLMAANKLTKDYAKRGDELIIPMTK